MMYFLLLYHCYNIPSKKFLPFRFFPHKFTLNKGSGEGVGETGKTEKGWSWKKENREKKNKGFVYCPVFFGSVSVFCLRGTENRTGSVYTSLKISDPLQFGPGPVRFLKKTNPTNNTLKPTRLFLLRLRDLFTLSDATQQNGRIKKRTASGKDR
jgi:hypothetical protein